LRIALELHLKRLIVGGFDKVYELGRIFRNEGVSTQHHPEFTMLESYEAYADYNDVMAMLEEMVSSVSQEVLGATMVKFGEDTIHFKPPWRRITLREAVKEYSGIDFVTHPTADGLREKMRSLKIEVDPQKNWAKLVDELIKSFVRPKLIQPTIIFDYPLSMSPLAKTKPGEERVVERFQAIAGGLEIANAYTELNDPLEQRERFEEQLKERQAGDEERWSIDEDYLLALEYGMPPTGGLGVGIDRLVMLLTNQPAIREVILFPQLKQDIFTILLLDNPANDNGIIDTVEVLATHNINDLVVGTFFLVNGTTYQCRDSEIIGSVTGGSKQIITGLDIDVKTGDLIGACWTNGHFSGKTPGRNRYMYAADKHTDPGDQVNYTLRTGATISLAGVGQGQRSSISIGRI